jgi:hypothetical protein
MTEPTSRILCKILFQKQEILTLTSQYALSLMRFLSPNLETYKFNTLVHTYMFVSLALRPSAGNDFFVHEVS